MTQEPAPQDMPPLPVPNVYALHHALGRYFQAAFGETGFTYPKFLALQALDQAGPMTLGTLSARVGVEPNTLSPLIKKMSAFGLIERARDPEDERRILLSLMPYGRIILVEATVTLKAAWDQLGISCAEAQNLSGLVEATRSKLEDAKPPVIFKVPPRPEE